MAAPVGPTGGSGAEADAASPDASREVASCRVISDSGLGWDAASVAAIGSYLHVEFWWSGQAEREMILAAAETAGGRYDLSRSLSGHI